MALGTHHMRKFHIRTITDIFLNLSPFVFFISDFFTEFGHVLNSSFAV